MLLMLLATQKNEDINALCSFKVCLIFECRFGLRFWEGTISDACTCDLDCIQVASHAIFEDHEIGNYCSSEATGSWLPRSHSFRSGTAPALPLQLHGNYHHGTLCYTVIKCLARLDAQIR